MRQGLVSIIICSRHKYLTESIQNNIQNTVGANFEIVWIDNSENAYNICDAYNEGVKRAKGEYLCFMHDDIQFLSDDWGNTCIDEMRDSRVWMIGIAGTKYLDVSTYYWFNTGYAVGHNWTSEKHRIFREYVNSQDVVAIDGMWMFTRKILFENRLRWDNNSFSGFDMYDMDICMQVITKGGSIKTLWNISIKHISDGDFSPRFNDACRKFHDKWDYVLPVATIPITNEVKNNANKALLNAYMQLEVENYNIKHSRIFRLFMRMVALIRAI